MLFQELRDGRGKSHLLFLLTEGEGAPDELRLPINRSVGKTLPFPLVDVGTGIEALDESLSPALDPSKRGMPLGRILALVGAPGAGKSLLADQIAVSAARAGHRVVMLVVDEPREDAAQRIGQPFLRLH